MWQVAQGSGTGARRLQKGCRLCHFRAILWPRTGLAGAAARCAGDPGGWKGRNMDKPKKCANPVCTCIPDDKSKYCSAHCEGQAGRVEVMCRCGHDECGGNVARK